MNITKEQLKSVIKSIIRENLSEREYQDLLSEVYPPGRKSEKMIQEVKRSLRKTHPDWNEERITSVAIATGWKAHNKGYLQEVGIPKGQLAKLNPKIADKGNKGKLNLPKGKVKESASYKVVSPREYQVQRDNQADKVQREPDIRETMGMEDEPNLSKWVSKYNPPKYNREDGVQHKPNVSKDREVGNAGPNNSCPKCQTSLEVKNGKYFCSNPDCMHSRNRHTFKPETTKEPDLSKWVSKYNPPKYNQADGVQYDPTQMRLNQKNA